MAHSCEIMWTNRAGTALKMLQMTLTVRRVVVWFQSHSDFFAVS